MPTVERDVPYAGYGKNVRIANDEVELLLATEYGPRIIRYAKHGGPNVFGEVSPTTQSKPTPYGDDWHIRGGHRLWYAPEGERSYWPDNSAVRVDLEGARVTLTQDVEGHTRLEKSITVELAASGSAVTVIHRITNRGALDVELAPWALSVMAKGGRGIFRQADFVPHPQALAPARPLVLWPFTRMNDPRWTWGDRYFLLRQDPTRPAAQKVGFYDDHGWMAYQLGRTLFIKRHRPAPGLHADFGCNTQTFTNDLILELESLGPLARIAPDGLVEHREYWSLFDGVELGDDEASLAAALAEMPDDRVSPER